jgi:hypothetical protein
MRVKSLHDIILGRDYRDTPQNATPVGMCTSPWPVEKWYKCECSYLSWRSGWNESVDRSQLELCRKECWSQCKIKQQKSSRVKSGVKSRAVAELKPGVKKQRRSSVKRGVKSREVGKLNQE